MRALNWISLPIMFWALACSGFAGDSQARSMASLSFQCSPPGTFQKHRSMSVRMRENTRQGVYMEYRHDSEWQRQVENDLMRLGMMFNLLSSKYWYVDFEGGVRIMNKQAGYEIGMILDCFSYRSMGLHVGVNCGQLEGNTFFDANASIGVLYSILELEVGYRKFHEYNLTSQGPFIGCCLWM